MGLIDGLFGNATEVAVSAVETEFARMLAEGERVEKAYQVIRDLLVFTDKRLLIVNKQGVTGKKIEYHSVPYRSITRFGIASAGSFDLDAELKIWVGSRTEPITQEFSKKLDIYEVQRVLARHVLG